MITQDRAAFVIAVASCSELRGPGWVAGVLGCGEEGLLKSLGLLWKARARVERKRGLEVLSMSNLTCALCT